MTLKLRPHHLLCSLSYAGKGYSQAFIENFDAICQRLENGECVQLVEGPDEICAPLLSDTQAHCHQSSVRERDQRALRDLSNALSQKLSIGSRLLLSAKHIHHLRQAFKSSTLRSACAGCEWHELCTSIASQDFGQARIRSS